MDTTIAQLRALRASLPRGKKDPFGKCCHSKRVLLTRALQKTSFMDLTEGEGEAVAIFLEHCKEMKARDKKFASSVAKIAAQTKVTKQ